MNYLIILPNWLGFQNFCFLLRLILDLRFKILLLLVFINNIIYEFLFLREQT